MALPLKFSTPTAYFNACVEFLQTHSWIYQAANTCFLKSEILDKLTDCEKNYFNNIDTEELNAFPLINNENHAKSAPKSLQDFRKKLKELIPDEAFQEPLAIDTAELPNFKKMNVKKQHEIYRLAHVINKLCDNDEILIDFGAGLGYLSEMLYKINSAYSIIGLESEEQRVQAACQRQTTNMPTTQNSIVYRQKLIDEDSAPYIEQSIDAMRPAQDNPSIKQPSSCTIIGLHACADLTVTSMRLFLSMMSVKRLIIMPCCYHKLKMSSEQTFVNFPLSSCLKNVLLLHSDAHSDIGGYFNRPFLRLACQQTLQRWRCCSAKEHAVHGMGMWKRAVAEALLSEEEVVIKQQRNNLKLDLAETSLSFDDLCQDYALRSSLDKTIVLTWQQRHELKFNAIISKYPAGAKLAEGLTCMQTTMQKFCENIVLYDRLCYMQEFAASNDLQLRARVVKLMNEKISPRCYALIAEKLT